MLRKTLSGGGSIVGDRIARFVISDDAIDRTSEQVVQDGGDYSLFLQNPIVLANHDPAHPIGTAANIRRDGTRTIADLTFAPPGVSQKADEVWGLIQASILKSVSIGFDPVAAEPMDPARPRGPQRYKKWVLCEISVVSIPAQTKATLIDATNAKAHTHSDRAERMAHAAQVLEKSNRRLRALDIIRTGREQEARHKAAEPPPLTPDERRAVARAITRAGMTENEKRVADLPPGRERYDAQRELHASKAAAGLAAKDWNTNASAEVRQAKGREVARKTRLAGW
jgi:hypothetical protein